VISYVVAQRTREMGVRLALGASSESVQLLVVRQALGVVVIGLALGLAVSLAATGLLRALLYEVSPTDPAALAGATLVLLATAALASYLPARRAARLTPIEVLRAD
jgi:putative ABC transport system permease protein